jgi:hypothetical protein
MKCGCKGKCACKPKGGKKTPHFEKGGKVMKTTPTADGGQQYVRNNDHKVAREVADRASDPGDFMGKTRKTVSPKAARMTAEASAYAITNQKDKGLAKRLGKIAGDGAEAQNAITREFGDRQRR